MNTFKKISKLGEIQGENIDWFAVGKRIIYVRTTIRGLSQTEASDQLDIAAETLRGLENPRVHYASRKSINIIWTLSHKWDLSINWILNGEGKPGDPDTVELMPPTLIIDRGAGKRRSTSREAAETGSFCEEAMEFVVAVDKFKVLNQMGFPTLTQLYDIMLALGYRKAVPARIAPLGHHVRKQKCAEKLHHIREPEEIEDFASSIQFDTPIDKAIRNVNRQKPKAQPA